jgi:hypothetical protein
MHILNGTITRKLHIFVSLYPNRKRQFETILSINKTMGHGLHAQKCCNPLFCCRQKYSGILHLQEISLHFFHSPLFLSG